VQLQLAQALLARRELDEAERLFQEELRRAGRSERAAYGLGLVAVARGNNRAATEYLTSVQQSSHVRKKATAQLATLAADRGDLAAAARFEKQLDTIATEDAPWPDPFVDELRDLRLGFKLLERRAEDLEHKGKFAEAAQLYLAQIEEQPTSRAYAGAASNLIQLRDYSRALALFRRGLQSDPDNGQLHYKLALAQLTRWDRWDEELRRNPEAQRSKEWLTEAMQHARRATEIQADDARAYLLWGWALMRLGEPAAAVEPLRRGVACRPEDFELQLALGEALLDAGQSHDAETHLDNARQLRPDSARVAQDLERLKRTKN
jgi:Flp pilus assembly protein TadD